MVANGTTIEIGWQERFSRFTSTRQMSGRICPVSHVGHETRLVINVKRADRKM
jgi:hypothetical protein